MAGPIESKAVAAPTTAAVIGYAVALVLAHSPGIRNWLGPEATLQAPAVLGAALGAVAAWVAPHTHRPDLAQDAPVIQGTGVKDNAVQAGPIAGAS